VVVPVALALILVLLYFTYGRLLDAVRVFTGVPFAGSSSNALARASGGAPRRFGRPGLRPAACIPPDPGIVSRAMNEDALVQRITVNPSIFGGKPVIRGRRLAVEHILGMLAAGDTPETILQGYAWLEPEDIRACLVYARRLVGHERIVPVVTDRST